MTKDSKHQKKIKIIHTLFLFKKKKNHPKAQKVNLGNHIGGQNSKEKHKSAMFCPTNIVLVAGSVGLVTCRDRPGAEEMLTPVDTRTCTFIYIL